MDDTKFYEYLGKYRFGLESCYTCADYRGRKNSLDLDLTAKCYSEKVLSKNFDHPIDATLLARSTLYVGCRCWRKSHSIGTLANCVTKQLSDERI